MSDEINYFQGEHRFLSNFYPSPIYVWELNFPTAEHAYQYANVWRPEDKEQILTIERPGAVKRFARDCSMVPQWDDLKWFFMCAVVNKKFEQNPELRKRLIETGDAYLREGNTWDDTFWGVVWRQDRWEGKNHLGKILMTVRNKYTLFGG